MVTTMRPNDRCHRATKTIITLALLTASAPGYSANWQLTPSLLVQEDYSSNLNLEASNEEDSFITQVNPGIALTKAGRYLEVNLNYNLQYLEYSSDQGNDRFNHQMALNAKSELIEDRFFVDVRSTYSQELASNRSASSGNNLNASDNLTDTFVTQIVPRWEQRLGRYTTVGATLTYDMVDYDSVQDDSDGTALNFFVDTKANPGKIFWSFDFDRGKATPDTSADIESESFNGELGYRYSPQLRGTVRLGYVDNHIDNPTDSDAGAGEFWGAGLLWNPSQRTTLNANYNSRLQTSQGYGLTFNHRQRRASWSVNYNENISSARQELLQFTSIGSLICPTGGNLNLAECSFVGPGTPILPNADQQVINFGALLPTLSETRFIQKSLNANLTLAADRHTVTVGVFNRERVFQAGGNDSEEDIGVNASWQVSLTGKTSASAQFSWSRLESSTAASDYQRTLAVSLDRRLSPKSNVRLQLRTNERDSADPNQAFTDHGASLSFNRTF